MLEDQKQAQKLSFLRERLRGVPPPPAITNPRVSLDEALPRLKHYFESLPMEPSFSNSDCDLWPATLDTYLNNHPLCESLDVFYEKIRKRCITHETISFIGSPAPQPLPPPSPLPSDFVDLLPRSLSSPASPAPDLLSIEFAQRRNQANGKSTKAHNKRGSPKKSRMPIRNPNLMGPLVHEVASASHHAIIRNIQLSKLESRVIAIPRKEIPKVEHAPPVVTAIAEHKPEQLSVTHRKKLLWATTQAIKNSFPECTNESGNFKRNVAALFRLCQTQWILTRSEANTTKKGTSERMLELAMKLAPSVVKTF